MAEELTIVKSWDPGTDTGRIVPSAEPKPSPFGPRPTPQRTDIRGLIDQYADQYGVDRNLAHTVAQMESGYNPRAHSPAGAIGLMQLMPATARSLGVRDPWDLAQNIEGGVKYLAQLGDRYNNDPRLTLAAYNAGPGAVDKSGGQVPKYRETLNYVAKGMRMLGSAGSANRDAAAASDTSAAAPTGGDSGDLFARIARGENVNLTDQDILRIAFGDGKKPEAAPAPKAEPAPLTIVKSWTPPPVKPPERTPLGKTAEAFLEGSKPLIDMMSLIQAGHDPVSAIQAGQTLKDIGLSLWNEPGRWAREVKQAVQSAQRGDVAATQQHTAGAIPLLGPAIQQVQQDIRRGDPAAAVGHGGALVAPLVVEPAMGAAIRGVEAVAPAVETAATAAKGAVTGGLRAGFEPVPITKFGVEMKVPKVVVTTPAGAAAARVMGVSPTAGAVVGGAAPFVRGAIRGAQEALERRRAARAGAAEAGVVESAPVAEPVTPVTAPTDEALLHLYSVETDPVKRTALRQQMADRGLVQEPGAAPQQNPYRDYSQTALQKTYAVETNPAKRAQIEQAARDRNLTLHTRETRRATAAVPETGQAEPRGPSLTQDEALMLRHLGIEDPLAADPESIAIARQFVAEQPDLVRQLRSGTPEKPAAPAAQPAAAAPVTEPRPAPAVAPVPTLDEIARGGEDGKPFARLSAADQERVRNIRAAMERAAAGTVEVPPPRPAAAPVRPAPVEPAPPPGKTAAEMLQEEYAAKRASLAQQPTRTLGEIQAEIKQRLITIQDLAKQAQTKPSPGVQAAIDREMAALQALKNEVPIPPGAVPPPAAAAPETPPSVAQQAQAAFEQAKAEKTIPVEPGKTPAELKADFEARQKPKAEEAVAPPPAAAPAAAQPQNLSDLMAGELPDIKQPGRSMYTETGELKSARQRGEEIKLANIEAKAQRFSKALTEFGMDPADVAKVKEGWVTAEAMKAGSPPGWENVMHDLIARGLLEKTEKRAPSESVPRIVELMQQKQIARPATAPAPQNLSELMKSPKAPRKPARKRRTPPER